jgi:hypothetical protein
MFKVYHNHPYLKHQITNNAKMTDENNEPELLEDIIESDLAVEPDAKVAEELRMLPEDEEGSDNE